MTYFPVQPRYSVYIDSLGDPLDDGYIYLGKANLDPTVYPAKASWDEAGLYPITFPVRTMNGYPLRDGIPAQMYLNFADNTEYSVLINDEDGVEVYSSTTGLIGYFPSGDGGDAATLNGLASDTAATAGTIAARDSSGDITANAFESTVATGTAPLTVASTTVVSNLNADMVDGVQASNLAKLDAANVFTTEQEINNGQLLVDHSVGGTNGVAIRIFSADNEAVFSSNNYNSSGLKYSRSGGSSYIKSDTTTGANAGDFVIFTAPNGTADAAITYSERFRVKQAGTVQVTTGPLTIAGNTAYHSGTSSASDTFTTADAKTVTVVNGLITSIV